MCWLFRNCKWLWWLSSDDDQCSAAVCWWQLCFCIDMWSTQSGTFVDRVTTTAGTPHANSEHGLGTALLQHDDSGCRQLWWSGECERFTISWSIWSWLTYQWYVMVFLHAATYILRLLLVRNAGLVGYSHFLLGLHRIWFFKSGDLGLQIRPGPGPWLEPNVLELEA